MRILVLGAGAIGSVLGGFLAKAGHEVTLLGRPPHMEAIRKSGLRISGIWGEHQERRLAVATAPEQVNGPPFDWIFVCVKSHQTADVAPLIPRWLSPSTLVCAFQNGLGNYEALLKSVPAEKLALGRVITGVDLEPGAVRVTVSADDVRIGAPDARVPKARIEELAAALKSAGVPASATPDIMTVIWGKVLYNCALKGLSAMLEVPYGALLDLEATRRLMPVIIDEAYRVAAAQKVKLEPTTAKAYTELLFTKLIPSTARHYASMLADLRRGKLTEIDSMNGAIVRLGQESGIAAPANALIARLVHEKEKFSGVA